MRMAVKLNVGAPASGNTYAYEEANDFDGDGVVTDQDLLNMSADFNGDGQVNIFDVIELLKFTTKASDARSADWLLVKNSSEVQDDDTSPEDSASYTAFVRGDIDANWTSSQAEQTVVKGHTHQAGDVVYRFNAGSFTFREAEGSEGIFSVSQSGVVTLNEAEAGKYSFAIVNKNGNERLVNIKVEAEDDSGPVFESANVVSIDSGVEAGDVVHTAVATDDTKLVKYRLEDAFNEGISIHAEEGM